MLQQNEGFLDVGLCEQHKIMYMYICFVSMVTVQCGRYKKIHFLNSVKCYRLFVGSEEVQLAAHLKHQLNYCTNLCMVHAVLHV